MTLTFYTNPMSRGQIARWALHEAGAQYEQQLLEYDTSMKDQDYLEINPMGKVPAIVHDTKIVTECAAICTYLAEAFPGVGLRPTNDELADYHRWMFFASGPLEAAITNKTLGFEIAAESEKTAGYGNYDRVVDILEQKFATDSYVCGDRFTMADVYVGAHITWGTQFNSLPARDSFQAYSERVTRREAYKEAKAIDDALIAAAEN